MAPEITKVKSQIVTSKSESADIDDSIPQAAAFRAASQGFSDQRQNMSVRDKELLHWQKTHPVHFLLNLDRRL